MLGPLLINCVLCWLLGHKWEGKRFYAADGDFEICSRCGLRGETNYYNDGFYADENFEKLK